MKKLAEHIKDQDVQFAVVIKSEILYLINHFLKSRGFIELLPTILSPITDPLNHEVYPGLIEVYNTKYFLTQSMILHKQIALKTFEKIFIVSPNIRFEKEKFNKKGKYLFEFAQVDIEIRDVKREVVMELIEEMLLFIFKKLKEKYWYQFELRGIDLFIPEVPFKRVKYNEAYSKYGKDFEEILSKKSKSPFWLIDIPVESREFYDKLSDNGKTLLDMDLILPEGYGEVLSGGERENEYDRIVYRMKLKGNKEDDFKYYLEFVKEFGLPATAGCGIGIERLTRFICKLKHVKYTRLFPKVPGEFGI